MSNGRNPKDYCRLQLYDDGFAPLPGCLHKATKKVTNLRMHMSDSANSLRQNERRFRGKNTCQAFIFITLYSKLFNNLSSYHDSSTLRVSFFVYEASMAVLRRHQISCVRLLLALRQGHIARIPSVPTLYGRNGQSD